MKYLFLFCGLLLSSNLGDYLINKETDRITWNKNDKLKWSDFKARPDYYNRGIAAITSSLIQYRYNCSDDTLSFKVKAIFVPDESWVRPEGKTDHVLAHEQIHFDITEFYARKLKMELHRKSFNCNQKEAFEKLVNKVLLEWRTTQSSYDRATHYSLNAKEQSFWQKKINRDLSSMSEFAQK